MQMSSEKVAAFYELWGNAWGAPTTVAYIINPLQCYYSVWLVAAKRQAFLTNIMAQKTPEIFDCHN